MKVLFVSNEVAPLAKVGGLADVAGSLPVALAERGIDVRVAMPCHRSCLDHGPFEEIVPSMRATLGAEGLDATVLQGSLGDGAVPLYLIKHDPLYDRPQIYGEGGGSYSDNPERFAFMASAALAIPDAVGFDADVVHANDWMAGMTPLFAARYTPARPTLFTLHNIGHGYQGEYPEEKAGPIGCLFDPETRHAGVINFMATGIRRAAVINTVSERYAHEIQTATFGCGLEDDLRTRSADLYGVVNGIDTGEWSPATDALIPAHYGAGDMAGKAECKAALQKAVGLPVDPDVPVLGCVSRLAHQKGLDVLADAIVDAIELPMQLVLLGTGESELEQRYAALAAAYPQSIAASISFSEPLARQIYAGSDLFAMPSRYEPCGLGQLISMAYGTVPVVSYTGGLADTVYEGGGAPNGFVHHTVAVDDVVDALRRAAEAFADKARWDSIVANGMARDSSWAESAGRYEELYRKAIHG